METIKYGANRLGVGLLYYFGAVGIAFVLAAPLLAWLASQGKNIDAETMSSITDLLKYSGKQAFWFGIMVIYGIRHRETWEHWSDGVKTGALRYLIYFGSAVGVQITLSVILIFKGADVDVADLYGMASYTLTLGVIYWWRHRKAA
jgi:hypothetical protein